MFKSFLRINSIVLTSVKERPFIFQVNFILPGQYLLRILCFLNTLSNLFNYVSLQTTVNETHSAN